MTDAPDACVFCGQPIQPGDPIAGRAPMAAHVTCADAALANDEHWEAIAAAGGEGTPTDEPDGRTRSGTATARQAGCLALIGIVVGAAALLAGAPLILA